MTEHLPEEENQTESSLTETQNKPWGLSFHGEGSKYFVISLINALLQTITLNFYYPWAKATKLNYLYEQTEFAGSRFKFHGTGKEMFIGYLKMLGIAAIILGGFFWATVEQQRILGLILLYGGLILVYPLAIHGTAKYRLSRTSWRGIFMGYRGKLDVLFPKFFIGILFSIFTFSLYWSWVEVDLRKYVTKNIRFGNVEFDFKGKGVDLFLIKLKYFAIAIGITIVIMILFFALGAFAAGYRNIFNPETGGLPTLTAGLIASIFLFYILFLALVGTIALMRQREVFQFYADNTHLYQNEKWHKVKLNMTFIDLLKLSVVNMLLIIFTLGLASPFVAIRNLHFVMPRLEIDSTFDPDSLAQTESNYRDAFGEDVGDWLDIDLA